MKFISVLSFALASQSALAEGLTKTQETTFLQMFERNKCNGLNEYQLPVDSYSKVKDTKEAARRVNSLFKQAFVKRSEDAALLKLWNDVDRQFRKTHWGVTDEYVLNNQNFRNYLHACTFWSLMAQAFVSPTRNSDGSAEAFRLVADKADWTGGMAELHDVLDEQRDAPRYVLGQILKLVILKSRDYNWTAQWTVGERKRIVQDIDVVLLYVTDDTVTKDVTEMRAFAKQLAEI